MTTSDIIVCVKPTDSLEPAEMIFTDEDSFLDKWAEAYVNNGTLMSRCNASITDDAGQTFVVDMMYGYFYNSGDRKGEGLGYLSAAASGILGDLMRKHNPTWIPHII